MKRVNIFFICLTIVFCVSCRHLEHKERVRVPKPKCWINAVYTALAVENALGYDTQIVLAYHKGLDLWHTQAWAKVGNGYRWVTLVYPPDIVIDDTLDGGWQKDDHSWTSYKYMSIKEAIEAWGK